VRIVRHHRPNDDQTLTAAEVAGYLAKYSTKTASDDVATTTAHHRRLQATIADLDLRAQVATLGNGRGPYVLLGHWGRMLGFRGHFATKSRRYSITLGQMRRARHAPRPASPPAAPPAPRWTWQASKLTSWPTKRKPPS
jgi:hypothetical protein